MSVRDQPNLGKLGPNKAKDAVKAEEKETLKVTPRKKAARPAKRA